MWVCPAAPTSSRRYEYIEYENGKLLGEKQYCSRGTSKVYTKISTEIFLTFNKTFIFLFRSTLGGGKVLLILMGYNLFIYVFFFSKDTCFGTVAIVSVFVMNKEKNLTDILI